VIAVKGAMLRNMGFIAWYRDVLFPDSKQAGAAAAAESGDAEAQCGLGLKFSHAGTGRDPGQAVRWFRRAALQDHALAQFNLGVMLTNGDGVPQDIAEGLTWTRKAADGGDPAAQYILGSKCHRSSVSHSDQDCAESRIEAYKWFYLAAAQGYQGSAAACERITLQMTREEVVDGNERVADFHARQAGVSKALSR
jgi:TPR repeat protein